MKHPSVDPVRQERARRYGSIQRKLYLAELILGGGAAILLVASGISVGLRGYFITITDNQQVLIALMLVALSLGYSCLQFPLTVWRGFNLPKQFGLSVQTFRAWLSDWVKGAIIGLVLGLVVVEVVYLLMDFSPRLWWLMAAGAMLLFTVVLANLAPIIFLPLFYKLVPLADEDLSRRLVALASRAGTRVRGVFTMDMSKKTTAANAALMGLGNTRRIVLGDTLLASYDADEIETILAHELGHHVHGDIPKGIVFQSVLTLAGFYLVDLVLRWGISHFGYLGMTDVAAMPLLAIVIGAFGLVSMPLSNGWSRNIEGAADRYALASTRNAPAFITAMAKLSDQNLSELHPPRWVEVLLYDHPAAGKRVDKARAWMQESRSAE